MPTLGNWFLNGTELKGVNVRVYPTAASLSRRKRQALEDLYAGSQVREGVGINLATKKIEFTCTSTTSTIADKWTMAAFILGVLDSQDEFTLKAPDGYYVVPALQSGQFACQEWTQTDVQGMAQVKISADSLYLGTSIADGGTYAASEPWREDFL